VLACRAIGVSGGRVLDQGTDPSHQLVSDGRGFVVGVVVHRRSEAYGDRYVALPVGLAPLGEQALTAPHRPGDQRCRGAHRDAGSAGLGARWDEGPADRALRVQPDDLAGLQRLHGRVDRRDRAAEAVDRQVMHPPHQRTRDRVLEHLLLGHEPHQAMLGQRGITHEREVEIADVVRGDHSTPVGGDVVHAGTVQPPVHDAERRTHEGDDRRVDHLHRVCPIVAARERLTLRVPYRRR
jgi:hypothetical protein